MARTAGSNGPKTMEAIRSNGLRLIYERGFEAMSLRQLAAEVGIQPGSLYNHISTKQDLLFDLVRGHMEELLLHLDAALQETAPAPSKLRSFIHFHLNYHIKKTKEVFICYSELRSLDPEHYAVIVALRKRYERRLAEILDQGVAEGNFAIQDTKVAAFGILAMLTGVCTWFRTDGRLTTEQLIEIYDDIVLKGVLGKPAA